MRGRWGEAGDLSVEVFELVAELCGLFVEFGVEGGLEFSAEPGDGDLAGVVGVGVFGGEFAEVLGGVFLGALDEGQ